MKKIITVLMIVLFAQTTSATVYTEEALITGMFTGSGNTVGVFHAGTKYNPAGCANGSDAAAYLINYSSTADWSKVHSMLITAYTTKTPIKIGVHPTICYAGFAVINRVAFGQGY